MTTKSATNHRPHILIVSDDVDLSTFLSEGLVYGGFWTSTIASGIQTLEVFRLRTFDLILIDAALGDLGAGEVIRRLRGRSSRVTTGARKIDIPIVIIAASQQEADAMSGNNSDVEGIVIAPIDLEDLVPTLHRVIELWRAGNPEREWADVVAQRPASESPTS